MGFFDLPASIFALRRIADGIEEHNRLLKRLADVLAPEIPPVNEEDLASTGPLRMTDQDQVALLEWQSRFADRVGRPPDELETAAWLDARDRGENL